MQTRWMVIVAGVTALHFASTMGSHLLANAQCRPVPGPGCQIIEPASQILSFPLLNVVAQHSGGTLGWRRAFVVLSVNSLLISAVGVAGIFLVARGISGRDPTP